MEQNEITKSSPTKIRNNFEKFVGKIKKAQEMGNKSIIDIAHSLAVLSGEEYEGILKEHSCKNIGEYAELTFDIRTTQTYDAIKVFTAFGDMATGKLLPAYAEYSFSYLKTVASLVLPDKEGNIAIPELQAAENEEEYLKAFYEIFPSDLTIRDIKEKTKEIRRGLKGIEEESTQEESTQEEPTQEEPTQEESTQEEPTDNYVGIIGEDTFRIALNLDEKEVNVLAPKPLNEYDGTIIITLVNTIVEKVGKNFSMHYAVEGENFSTYYVV